MIWSLMAPVNVYAMQISGVKIPEPPLTIARIVSQAVMFATMAILVKPVILTIMMMSTASVKLNAHLLNSAIPTSPTIARWIVAQTAKFALTPPPVPTVKMVFTLTPTPARFAPQTVRLALMPPTVTPVLMVIPVMYVPNV